MKPCLPEFLARKGYKILFALLSLVCLGFTPAASEEEPVPAPVPKKIVIVDPGHGGRVDAGILLADRIPEKERVLQLAQSLQRLLQQDPNLEVFLTRAQDSGLTVLERSNAANRRSTSLFISLHIGSSRGLSVYVGRFVRDDQLAAAAEQGIQANLPAVPWELAQNRFLPKSKKLAETLLGVWKQAHAGLPDAEPINLPLAVLAGVHCPAVLVELPPEKALWEKESARQEMAGTLAAGISAFLAGE